MSNKKSGNNFAKIRINTVIVAGSISVITIVTVLGIVFSRQYIVSQAESRIQDVLQEAEALHYYVQREMHPTMYLLKEEGRLPKEFYSPEILSSSYISRHVFSQYNTIRKSNKLPLVEYRMASKNPRNMINKADSIEANLIDLFNSDPSIKKYTGIVKQHGEKHLYYARPFLRVENNCLKCHGKKEDAPYDLSSYYNWDSGFDLKLGEIPAIEIIKTPIIAEFKTVTIIGFIILTIALVLITLIILYSRLFVTNKIINQQKNEIEDNLNKLKAAQNQLVQSEKMASLGVLTAGIAHEINNPLNFINGAYLGLDSFFASKAPQHKDEVSVLLKGLHTGVERASAIIQGLNHFSRDSKSYNEECRLHTIIDNCLLMLQNKYKNRIEIDKQYGPKEIIVRGNDGKLHQLFMNLLLNAIQAIENKGIISIITQENENLATVTITDNGCGINSENLSKVFDPFFTTKAPGEGTGLGLSISYNIVKDHKGDIEFKSETGKGTTVKLTLPIN